MSQPEKHPSSSSKLSFEEPSPGIFTPDPVSSSSELHFDPGPLAPRRRSTSCCKLFLGVIVVLIAIFVGKVLYIIGTTLYTQTTFPFRPLYQNQTMNEVKNRSMVVQPLVGDDQTFDIAVTVWTLKEEPEAENNETVLFSDIVFRDLRLKDKYKSVDVAFQVPTAMFHRPTINSTDLRASFVLIPSSSSPLDYLKSYSSWYPSGMQRPPIRSYSTERSLVDETLDSFGISIPLLTGGEIPSRCGSAEEEEEEEEGDDAPKSQHLLRDHPFVMTRTQIRVADETHILNRRAYDRAHKALRKTACGGSQNFSQCRRGYIKNGHFETRMELIVPDETGFQTQFAYSPYLSNLAGLSSHKDLLRIPVTREKCANINKTMEPIDQDYLNVTWHLSYAGRTPEKMTMGEFYNGLINQRYKNMSLSEHELDQGRMFIEGFNGLFGLRSDKVEHPRRQFFAILILETAPILMWILIAAYWRGLNSTRYISISGTLLFAMAEPLSYMTWELEGIRDALEMALSILLFFPYIIMLKVVTRVEILQLLWIPNVRIRQATHLERASARIDGRTGWKLRIGVFFGIFLTCALLKPHERLIFSPTLQPLHKTVSFFRAVVLGNGAVAAQLSGTLFQLLMNQRCRVFAGQYKATVWITGLVILNDWIFVSPRIFGQADPKAKISALDVIYLILCLCQAWQAVNLPRAKVEEDENVD